MTSPKRTYKNAGAQTQQGRFESIQYWDAPDTDLFTVKGISLVLGINRNAVKQIPVQRIMINKRGYYRKGDIRAWMESDLKEPDSLLLKLRAEQTKATDRKRTQPSRRYISGQLSREEAKQIRSSVRVTTPPADTYEARVVARKAGADSPTEQWTSGRNTKAAVNLLAAWTRKK